MAADRAIDDQRFVAATEQMAEELAAQVPDAADRFPEAGIEFIV